jgi:hypothetical protein
MTTRIVEGLLPGQIHFSFAAGNSSLE